MHRAEPRALGLGLASIKAHSTDLFARDGSRSALRGCSCRSIGAALYPERGLAQFCRRFLFESVSGFSTTGATVLTDVETLSRSCMLWRLLSQWIGGMGVLVFMLAVMPMSGEHSMHIVRAEFQGRRSANLSRACADGEILYLLYVGMTLLEFVLLTCGGMSIYESARPRLCFCRHRRLSTRNASLGEFNSLYIGVVATVFELLFSVNFLYITASSPAEPVPALRNEELHCFIGIVLFAVVSIAINLYSRGYYGGIATLRCIGLSSNVSMSISTSSFATVDYSLAAVLQVDAAHADADRRLRR